MHKDLIAISVRKFPKLLEADRTGPPQNPFHQFGIEIGNGWFRIFYQMLSDLDELRKSGEYIALRQVKEKWGGLRVYIDGPDEADDIVSKYSEMSYQICEICGQKGKPRNDGWIMTLCDTHHGNRNAPCSEETINLMIKDAKDGTI